MTRYISERLAASHKLDRFASGAVSLDTWLANHARQAQAIRTAQSFVWHGGDELVVAYFSLAAHMVTRSTLSARVGRGSPESIPAILLARLALDRSLHGTGLGGELLWDALGRAVAASEIAAARLIVVDAIDEPAVAFYRHHGFQPIPENVFRLVQKVSDVAAALR